MGYQAKGILSGFSALYAIFVFGCLIGFIIVLVVIPNSWERYVFATPLFLGFIVLAIYACIRERKHPETFATKQIQEINVSIAETKLPKQKRARVITSQPVPPPIDQDNKPKALMP